METDEGVRKSGCGRVGAGEWVQKWVRIGGVEQMIHKNHPSTTAKGRNTVATCCMLQGMRFGVLS